MTSSTDVPIARATWGRSQYTTAQKGDLSLWLLTVSEVPSDEPVRIRPPLLAQILPSRSSLIPSHSIHHVVKLIERMNTERGSNRAKLGSRKFPSRCPNISAI